MSIENFFFLIEINETVDGAENDLVIHDGYHWLFQEVYVRREQLWEYIKNRSFFAEETEMIYWLTNPIDMIEVSKMALDNIRWC